MLTREESSDFLGYVYDIFCELAQKKPESVDLTFSKKIDYPMIIRFPKMSIIMPLPRFKEGLFYFEGFVFEDTPEQRSDLWALFLASIYHLAAHDAISRYFVYQKWVENKTDDVCIKVIDFIEDFFVEKYISSAWPEISKNLLRITERLVEFERSASNHVMERTPILPPAFSAKDGDIMRKIRLDLDKIENNSFFDGYILQVADSLYKNRHLLNKTTLAYCEHGEQMNGISYKNECLQLEMGDDFKEVVFKLDDLWATSEQARIKMIRQYKKYLKGLQFDSIALSPQNFHKFAETRESILPMIRRIKQQIRTIVNVTDSPKIDEIGLVDMQMAIQSIASKGKMMEVFEQVEDRRAEEAWIILIDKSASMRLRFDHIKEFSICVAEAANELTGKSDAWAMYSFDNNFQIIKDFNEKYGKQVQARLGGLQNSGLSLLPDAIELSYRILVADQREKKFLFVITDGHPSGYDKIQEQFSKIAKKVEVSGVILVAIGVSRATARKFRNNARGNDLKQLVAKFITAYRTASSDM